MNYALILAAGINSRMKNDYPKCLYPLFRKPMIEYIYDSINEVNLIDQIITIIGYKKELFKSYESKNNILVEQINTYGTGAAAKSAIPYIKNSGFTLIIPGDKPLIPSTVLKNFINYHKTSNNDLSIISTYEAGNTNYGRIIKNSERIIKILEFKDITNLEERLSEMNTSIYIINNQIYKEIVSEITLHDKELLLTDIINIASNKNYKIGSFLNPNYHYFLGMNDYYDLSKIEEYIRMQINKNHMKNGICLINPKTITIGKEVVIEKNTIINPNTFITGNTTIKANCIIGPNTEIHNSFIGCDTLVKHSLIYDSKIGNSCSIGPFAHLRMNNVIDNDVKIGNFVEVKNSSIKSNTKASHLSYIGDSFVGKNVNIGCGVITVNYDGLNKYQTKIGDNVFIGCNSNLIAPVKIDDNAMIAAGSTITTNVPKNSFSIARSLQITKEGYALKYPYAKKYLNEEK